MMMLVSRRNLPFTGFDLFAFLFDALPILAGRKGVERRRELEQGLAVFAHGRGCGQGSDKTENLHLQFRRQIIDLSRYLLSDIHLPIPQHFRITCRVTSSGCIVCAALPLDALCADLTWTRAGRQIPGRLVPVDREDSRSRTGGYEIGPGL